MVGGASRVSTAFSSRLLFVSVFFLPSTGPSRLLQGALSLGTVSPHLVHSAKTHESRAMMLRWKLAKARSNGVMALTAAPAPWPRDRPPVPPGREQRAGAVLPPRFPARAPLAAPVAACSRASGSPAARRRRWLLLEHEPPVLPALGAAPNPVQDANAFSRCSAVATVRTHTPALAAMAALDGSRRPVRWFRKSKINVPSTARPVWPAAPPWWPGWCVLRSKSRARCQRRTAAFFGMAANWTGLATLPDQTGHGSWPAR
jgi:hypothetical protein